MTYAFSPVGACLAVDANTTSFRRKLPNCSHLMLSIAANGCWVRIGDDSVVAAAPAIGAVAVQTLTSTGAFLGGETVTLDTRVYTYRAALSSGPTVANEVLIGANQTASHLNLLKAVNGSGTPGTEYSVGTIRHATVEATSSDGTHTIFAAREQGTAGNSIASTETLTNASFGAATFASGTAVTDAGFYLPPAIVLVIANPREGTALPVYIAAIKNTTAAVLNCQPMND